MATVASLTVVELAVDAGSQASTSIRVRNTGSIVDRFDIDVVGPAVEWVRVDPPSVSLFPGADGTATITFAPPRAAMPRAGIYPFGVRVRPAADPRGSTVEEGRITVNPFTAVTADIAPQTSRGARRGRHDVAVTNGGNAPVEVIVSAVDPDRRLGLAVSPVRAVVGPEARASFGVDVRVDDPFPFGSARQRPFLVNVQPGRQPPIQLRATLSQRAILPSWIPPLGGLAVAAVVLAVGAYAAGAGPFAPKPTPAPTLVAQVTPAPTATPVVTASPSPSQSVAPTPTPTPPPINAAKDLTLTATGDTQTLGGGLSLKCAATDATCRSSAKDTVLAILNGLANQYTGAGIVSARSVSVPNALPLVITSKRDIPWSQAGGGQSGTTKSIVIDLGPLLANPPSFVYVLVTTSDGIPHRYLVDPGIAQQLFNDLYEVPPEMTPTVTATLPPINTSFFAQPIWDQQWVLDVPLTTPAP